MSGNALRAEKRVIVLPEPGGPQSTEKYHQLIPSNKNNQSLKLPSGLCSASHV